MAVTYYLLYVAITSLRPLPHEAPPLDRDTRDSQSACRISRPSHQHVFYLKTHKTGSTTIYSIMAEYTRTHDLFALLPKGHHINIFYKNLEPEHMLTLYPGVNKYDMVFNHNIFDPKIYELLHNDTFTFTTLRKPKTNFISSFNYWSQLGGFTYLVEIPGNGNEKLDNYLKSPEMYEPKNRYMSFTNNRQSIDLGWDLNYDFNDAEYTKSFLRGLEQHFDIFLIFEYFDESLVMLKRILNWRTQDIIFFKKLKFTNLTERQKRKTSMTPEQEAVFNAMAVADNALYEHFLAAFKEKIALEPGLQEEVEEFKAVLEKVKHFCADDTSQQLVVPRGDWTDEVTIVKDKCYWLAVDETAYTDYLRHDQWFRYNGTRARKQSAIEER